MTPRPPHPCASGVEAARPAPLLPRRAAHRTGLGSLMLAFTWLLAPTLYGQRSSLETQVPGGFLVLEDLVAIGGQEVIAVGHMEQDFRFGALCRIDHGTVVWSKKLRNSEPYYANTFHAAVSLAGNTDILVAGQDVRSTPNCHLARLDPSGALVWSTTVNAGPGQQHFSEVLEGPDGNIYAAGTIGDPDGDIILAKFSSDGALLWIRIVDQPDHQYTQSMELANNTLHILGYSASNAGDVMLYSFSLDGDMILTRYLFDEGSQEPMGMAVDSSGGLLILYRVGDHDHFILRVPTGLALNFAVWTIDTALDLQLFAGILYDPASQHCVLMGTQGGVAYAFRFSLASYTVIWERTFPDLYSFFGMTLTGDGTTLVATGGPFGPLPNGSYPSELVQLDPATGIERSGMTCVPSPSSSISISYAIVGYVGMMLPTRTPDASVSHGMEVSELPLVPTFCEPTILPVEMMEWSAEPREEQVQLSWSTATERNSDRFLIERSHDTEHWEVLGEVGGAGNSATRIDYSWVDDAPVAGTNYYRLRQRDLDGSETITDVRAVEWTSDEPLPLFHPNPAAPGQWITATGTVQVLDPLGKRILGPVTGFAAPDRAGIYLVQGPDRCERLVVQ